MLNNFKLGTNFDMELLKSVIALNNSIKNGNKITELYGSDRKHAMLAARPDFRLPDIDKKHFEEYVKFAKVNGINFNYTMNSISPYGSKKEVLKNFTNIVDFVNYCQDVGVYRITIANPIILEIIRKYAKSDIELEASTIMHIDTVTQMRYLFENYGVKKFCCNLNKNRDFNFLEAASKYCNNNGLILELMVNEFCGVGGDNYATHCVYRDSCYICHATNKNLLDTLSLNEYPMKLCTESRAKSPANWLRVKFIRPEDIVRYNDIGINNFKITGRTGSSEYILRTAKAYLEEEFNGNLLALWKPLESIKGESEDKHICYIDNKSLAGFMSYWSKQKHVCDNEVCGQTCDYCEDFYNKYCKEKNNA